MRFFRFSEESIFDPILVVTWLRFAIQKPPNFKKNRSQAASKKRTFSDETAQKIDFEVRSIIQTCYEKAGTILSKNLDKLHNMADALLKYETIDQEQISDIMAGAFPREKNDDNQKGKENNKVKTSSSSKPVQDS